MNTNILKVKSTSLYGDDDIDVIEYTIYYSRRENNNPKILDLIISDDDFVLDISTEEFSATNGITILSDIIDDFLDTSTILSDDIIQQIKNNIDAFILDESYDMFRIKLSKSDFNIYNNKNDVKPIYDILTNDPRLGIKNIEIEN